MKSERRANDGAYTANGEICARFARPYARATPYAHPPGVAPGTIASTCELADAKSRAPRAAVCASARGRTPRVPRNVQSFKRTAPVLVLGSVSARLQSRVLACSQSAKKNTDHLLASGGPTPAKASSADTPPAPRWTTRGDDTGARRRAEKAPSRPRLRPMRRRGRRFPRLPSLPPSSPREAPPEAGKRRATPSWTHSRLRPHHRVRGSTPRAPRHAARRPPPSRMASFRVLQRTTRLREKRPSTSVREKASPPFRRRRLRKRRSRRRTRCLSCSREGGCTASRRRVNPVARYPRRRSISPTTSSAWRSTPRPPKRCGA